VLYVLYCVVNMCILFYTLTFIFNTSSIILFYSFYLIYAYATILFYHFAKNNFNLLCI